MQSLSKKCVLVTGAARRIGRATALAFADAGADVAITYRTSKTAAQTVVKALESRNVRATAIECDVRIPESVEQAVSEASKFLGRLDILVNNAGTFESAVLAEITLEQWDTMFETNTRGPFLVARAAYPHLRKTRGRIINIGSLGGLHPWSTHGHYSASKAALHMLTQTMAKAFAPEISVNCVAPGMIVFGGVNPAYEEFARKTPMQKNGSGEDVAEAVLFFARGPRFITGQILGVDGGLSL